MSNEKQGETDKRDSSLTEANPDAGSDMQARVRAKLEGTDLTPYADDNANLGMALRRVYQQTVDESVPMEMLDLLKRLN